MVRPYKRRESLGKRKDKGEIGEEGEPLGENTHRC